MVAPRIIQATVAKMKMTTRASTRLAVDISWLEVAAGENTSMTRRRPACQPKTQPGRRLGLVQQQTSPDNRRQHQLKGRQHIENQPESFHDWQHMRGTLPSRFLAFFHERALGHCLLASVSRPNSVTPAERTPSTTSTTDL